MAADAGDSERRSRADSRDSFGSDAELERVASSSKLLLLRTTSDGSLAAPLSAASPGAVFMPVEPAPPSPGAAFEDALREEHLIAVEAEAAVDALADEAGEHGTAECLVLARRACETFFEDPRRRRALRRAVVDAVDGRRGGDARVHAALRAVLDATRDDPSPPKLTGAARRAESREAAAAPPPPPPPAAAGRTRAASELSACTTASPAALAAATADADRERTAERARDLERSLAAAGALDGFYDESEEASAERIEAERLLVILRGELAAVDALRSVGINHRSTAGPGYLGDSMANPSTSLESNSFSMILEPFVPGYPTTVKQKSIGEILSESTRVEGILNRSFPS